MGNQGEKGAKIETNKTPWIKLDAADQKNVMGIYQKFINTEKVFNTDAFVSDAFMILDKKIKPNIISYLNSYYEEKGDKRKIQNSLEIIDVMALANILLKANSDFDDTIYFRKNTFLILYDITKGKVGAYKDNAENFNLDELLDIFNFTTLIYFNRYARRSTKFKANNNNSFTEDFNKEMKQYLTDNIFPSESGQESEVITLTLLENFIDTKLYALNGFLNHHFNAYFIDRFDDTGNSVSSFPLFNDPPSTMPSYQFFYYCLSNSIISSVTYAFKLYDCKIQGYNLSDLIYSFLGFTGPITIFVQHYDEKKDKTIILGMFINSNFKECYEKFCGDDSSNIFTIEPKMTFYNCIGDKDHICYISSKNQKFSKVRPGIGLGYRAGEVRFWLDSNELFSKSFFSKYDNVFEEGSPFEELKEKLNIGNIEVYGYGCEDDLQNLMKKQERDKNICDKMKKVDKASFATNDFDKEMFFGKTFQHRNDIDERAAIDKDKK